MLRRGVGPVTPEFDESRLHHVLGVRHRRDPLAGEEEQLGRKLPVAGLPVFIGWTVGHRWEVHWENATGVSLCVENLGLLLLVIVLILVLDKDLQGTRTGKEGVTPRDRDW